MKSRTQSTVHPNRLEAAPGDGSKTFFKTRDHGYFSCHGDHDVDRAGKRIALTGDGRHEHIAECRTERRQAGPTWASLPLGRCDGGEFGLNLADKPHAIITGQPGTGKTDALKVLTTEALSKGFDVKWIRVDGCEAPRLSQVLAEVKLRTRIHLDNGAAYKRRDFRPLLVVLDDFDLRGTPWIGTLAEIDDIAKAAPGAGVHLIVAREHGNTFLQQSLTRQATEIELVERGIDAHGGRVRWASEEDLHFSLDGSVELAGALATA